MESTRKHNCNSRVCPTSLILYWLFAFFILFIGVAQARYGASFSDKAHFQQDNTADDPQPQVLGINIANDSMGVKLLPTITSSNIYLPNSGIDPKTLNSTNVSLYQVDENGDNLTAVASTLGTSAGLDVISLTPDNELLPNTIYKFEVTAGLKDQDGISFTPFSSFFTTGSGESAYNGPIKFVGSITVASGGNGFTSLAIGPDDKLYALSSDGLIKRWRIDHQTGLLSNEQTISTIINAEGDNRLAIGMAFDPQATADNLILWISHSKYGFDDQPDFQGKISRLSGAYLEEIQDYVTHLPRSRKDHATNGVSFGPDGALYILQGSSSAMGSYDNAWQRNEALLSGAMLRLDLDLIKSKNIALPIDAKTEQGGSYNPYEADAPLTLYATGLRNAYDMVWHSNGQLYIPTNGSAGLANAPGSDPGSINYMEPQYNTYAGPVVPYVSGIPSQDDYVFRVEQGGYYGHPNPRRAEYVLNGGNPANNPQWPEAVVPEYPAGIEPDANYRGYSHNLGSNKSPNGVIEYKSSSFNGALAGKMINAWLTPSEIVVLEPGTGPDHDIAQVIEGIPGFSGFNKPLDIIEDTKNGNLYISEYQSTIQQGTGKITLLKPAVRPVNEGLSEEIRINFQNKSASIHEGWLKDYGQPYGKRTGEGQGEDMTYGWLKVDKNTPLDFTKNGRNRGTPNGEPLLQTLVHMQGDDITDGEGGTPEEGTWGIAVPNGAYHVTVTVGDGLEVSGVHHINVEGVNLINKFVPSRSKGVSSMFATASVEVTVSDNVLNIDAFDGGENTKINSVVIKPGGPKAAEAIALDVKKVVLDDVSADNTASNFTVNLSNEGYEPINSIDFSISGSNADEFSIDDSSVDLPLAANESTSFTVQFNATGNGVKTAMLTINSNNGGVIKDIELRGLGKTGLGNDKEPSLQWILDAYGLGIEVGDDDPGTVVINSNSSEQKAPLLGDEITAQSFIRASKAPVTVEVLAVYGPRSKNPIVGFGWYKNSTPSTSHELFTVSNNPTINGQTLNVTTKGDLNFDPGQHPFGFYNRWPFFGNRHVYSADKLNSFEDAIPHHLRVYPISGEENAYVIATEENPTGFDYQDIIVIVRNVEPYTAADGPEIALENMNKIPETQLGFPADDLYTFHRSKDPINTDKETIKFHDTNVMRVHNYGTELLTIEDFEISDPERFAVSELNGEEFTGDEFPVNIEAGDYIDVTVEFIESSGGKGLREETLTIHSNAGNNSTLTASLKGVYMKEVEGSDEVDLINIMRAFGFTTSMNDQPSPSSDFPSAEEVDNGVHGDLILSRTFVQADPDQPVRAFQLAAFKGPGSGARTKLIKENSTDLISGFTFKYGTDWHQTFFPREDNNSDVIAHDFANTIGEPFRIMIADYPSSGGNTSGDKENELLGVRVYKAVDREGKVIPNHYLVIQDYVQNGCGSASANCDWNDNLIYFTNIKPATDPSIIAALDDIAVQEDASFTYDASIAFDKGYPGNKLSYTASLSSGEALPSWLSMDSQTGKISGTPPADASSVVVAVTATDVNGVKLSNVNSTTFRIQVEKQSDNNEELWLEAECASVGSNFNLADDADASGGSYVAIKSGYNSKNNPPDNSADIVMFNFDITQPGNFHAFTRVKASGNNGDSFWVRVDGGDWFVWEVSQLQDNIFAWSELQDSLFSFTTGTHTVEIAYREGGSFLDKLYLTSTDDVPSGMGEAASNSCEEEPENADDGENADDDGENADDDGENPDDDGENADDDGENPDDDGENPDDDEVLAVGDECDTCEDPDVIVFPNPGKGQFTVRLPEKLTGSYMLRLSTIEGKVIRGDHVKKTSDTVILNLQGAAPGIYILQILTKEKTFIKRIEKL